MAEDHACPGRTVGRAWAECQLHTSACRDPCSHPGSQGYAAQPLGASVCPTVAHQRDAAPPGRPPGLASLGWTQVFTDSFDTSLISWTASFTGTGATAAKWKTVTTTADRAYNPSSLYSAWPAADGLQAGDPNSGNYPNNLNSWMIHGPIDLSTKKAAEIYYSQNYTHNGYKFTFLNV
jgi:hypothetical protein